MGEPNDDIWTLVAKQVTGELTEEEARRLAEWQQQRPENHTTVEQAKEMWQRSKETEITYEPDVEEGWQRFLFRREQNGLDDSRPDGSELDGSELDGSEPGVLRLTSGTPDSKARKLIWWSGIAASLVLLFTIGLLWRNTASETEWEQFATAEGEKLLLTLPDSSQVWLNSTFGAEFHDFAGSVVVHAMGGFLAFGAVFLLGARKGRYGRDGRVNAILPSNIPFLALGSWILCVGWFGFNVMSAGNAEGASDLVAINSLLAMVGGLLAALVAGKNDPGFVHNGALAGLVAICAGSDIVHPVGALVIGGVAGAGFVYGFQFIQTKLKLDDVLGVVPLHGGAGLWGGIAAGIFGSTALGGAGGVTFMSQVVGTLTGVAIAIAGGFIVYGAVKAMMGIRLSEEDEYMGADLAIHQISANPEEDMGA